MSRPESREVSIGVDLGARPRWSSLNVTHLAERGGLDDGKTAIVFEDRSRTYAELRDRYRRIANALVDLGVRPLERAAVTATNCLEYLEIELGIAGAGAIMVPLSWRLSPPERINLLRRSAARVIFAEDRFVEQLNAARDAGELPNLRTIVVLGGSAVADAAYEELCTFASAERPDLPITHEDPHEIIYTSGTTGLPKGAVWTHGTLLWNSIEQVMDYGLKPSHSTYVMLDLNYIGGRHDYTWPLIHQGGTVHIRRSGGFDAKQVLDYIEEHRISHVLWVPTMLYELLQLPGLDRYDTRCLEMIMCGGAPLSTSVIEQAQSSFPHTNFVQVYGLTEGGGTVTFVPPEYLRTKVGSAGKASMHNEIRIVDDHRRPCPPNEPGEILVKGPTVMAGYWDNPEATEQAVVDGWLHTGDLGYLDEDGFLYVSGRKTDMIISGGMNIYPSEIEDVLRGHPSVVDVAAIGLPDVKWGERVCAVIQAAPGAAIDEQEVIAYCRERLASYKKPTVVRTVDAFPRTLSGKIQKFVLVERFKDGSEGG